jgi:hypothetical protein
VCVRAWMMRCIRLLYTGLGFWTVLYAVCYACHVQAMCWQGPRWWCNVHYYSIYTRQRDQSCLGQNAQRRPCSQHKHSPIPLSLSLSLSRNLHNHAPNHLNLYAGLPLLRFPRQDASGRSLQPLFGYRERGSLCVLDVADIEGVCALLLGIIFLGRLYDFCATAAFRRLFFQEAVDCVELGFC